TSLRLMSLSDRPQTAGRLPEYKQKPSHTSLWPAIPTAGKNNTSPLTSVPYQTHCGWLSRPTPKEVRTIMPIRSTKSERTKTLTQLVAPCPRTDLIPPNGQPCLVPENTWLDHASVTHLHFVASAHSASH